MAFASFASRSHSSSFAIQSTFMFFISVNVARRWNERKTVFRSQ